MREHRLLERIRRLEKNPSRRITEDPNEMIHSVQEHLQCLLNTRQGSAPIADDYGIPDFTNLMTGFDESKRSVEQTIRNTILTYEPRLQGVRVTLLQQDDDKLSLRFQISAQLISRDSHDPVMFESVLDAGGRFSVKS